MIMNKAIIFYSSWYQSSFAYNRFLTAPVLQAFRKTQGHTNDTYVTSLFQIFSNFMVPWPTMVLDIQQ